MDQLRIVTALAFGIAITATAEAADWKVDAAMSSVGFVAEQQGSRFNGRFQTFDATISFDPAKPSAGRIIGTVATDSVNTRDHDRDAALTDRDWFDSANYPEARFESESIEALDDGSFEASGELTLKGTTKPAKLTFAFEESGAGAQFDGKMMINRFDFNVGEGWNDTSWVGQNVEVQIELSLMR
jgi:polyisoprenoid-binding protein YceI